MIGTGALAAAVTRRTNRRAAVLAAAAAVIALGAFGLQRAVRDDYFGGVRRGENKYPAVAEILPHADWYDFGAKYDDAASWLGPLSLAIALYALATVYLYHFLSLARTRFALVLVALFGLQLVAFAVLHDRPADLVGIQIATSAVSVVAAEVWYLLRH